MHLESLDIYGFKSFADKTHVDFTKGITCLVGPNGSGKSNIVDAIKWVLGTQSPSSLRMEFLGDVIFKGTNNSSSANSKKRDRAKYAEVSIVFSNEDRALNIDTSHVEIKRRVTITTFRSNDDFDTNNEYFINRQPCRLKDINILLSDTGLGRSSYSILEQGKIDDILKANPLDRRAIFEEAASISKSRQEEKEAQSRLASADEKLKEVQISFNQCSREYNRLKNQSEVAEKYTKDKTELKTLEDKYTILEIKKFEDEKKDYEKKINKYNEELNSLEEKAKKFEEKRTENQTLLHQINEDLIRLESRIEFLVNSNDTKQEAKKGHIANKDSFLKSYEEIIKRKQSVVDEESGYIKEKKVLEENLKKVNESLSQIEKELQNLTVRENEISETIAAKEKDKNNHLAEKKEVEDKLFKTYEEFISKAHKVISLVFDTVKGDENVDNKVNIESLIISSLNELNVILSSQGSLSDDNLANAKSLIGKIISYFDEYTKISIDFANIKKDIKVIEEAKKIDDLVVPLFKEINDITEKISAIDEEINKCFEEKKKVQRDYVSTNEKKQELSAEFISCKSKIDSISFSLNNLLRRKKDIESDEAEHKKRLDDLDKVIKTLESEIEDNEKEANKKAKERDSKTKKKEQIEELLIKFGDKNQVQAEKIKGDIIVNKTKIENVEENIKRISQDYFDRENISIDELKEKVKISDRDDIAEIKRRAASLRTQIKSYGNINYLAAEEFKEAKAQYEKYKTQLDDYTKSKEDLKDVVKEIHDRSRELFLETFNKINTNFNIFYSAISLGGTASISLQEDEDALNSGVEILAQPPGKVVSYVKSLSGGEKTMATIALFFAIYQIKPAPFCLLDELDAALDGKNVNAFLSMLRDFKDTSQFIIITHNENTVKGADSLLGTTQVEQGVTKVLGYIIDKSGEGEPVFRDSKTGRTVNVKLQ